MNKVQDIRIEDYNYELPNEKIARFPLDKRDESKLLTYQKGIISEDIFKQVDAYLPEDCLMVFNNTKVIQARLIFQKETGALIEVFCLEPKDPNDYVLSFQERKSCTWLCLVGNARKWKEGKLKLVPETTGKNGTIHTIYAEKVESYGDTHLIRFEWGNPDLTFADILGKYGELPIPPYLNRKTEEKDKETYQTIYSKIKGSVAAPTAGLHFTPEVFENLEKKGIIRKEVTLHVGAGTFKPVKSESIGEHEMHVEMVSVERETIEQVLKHLGNIFAVGTTSVRTLESLYYIGANLHNSDLGIKELQVSQWDPYQQKNNQLSVRGALETILLYLEKNKLEQITAHTQIMIVPGYTFKIVSGIITNFHQPKSTLLLLISAFAGDDWKRIYNYALSHDFRFLSYGDSSILKK